MTARIPCKRGRTVRTALSLFLRNTLARIRHLLTCSTILESTFSRPDIGGWASKNSPPSSLPFRGRGKAISLLLLVSAVGGNVPIRHLIDDGIFQTTVIYVDYWKAPLPPHDFIFNTVGDADLCRGALLNARRLIATSNAPVLNMPDAVLPTGRAENAIRLAALPGVRAAKTITLPRKKLMGHGVSSVLARHGMTFPLLLRSPGYHTGQHFERIENIEQLSDAAARLPGQKLMLIEFLDAEGKDGKARKYRAIFVNGEILPLHLCVSNDWKVHYYTSAMAVSASYRAEEARFLNDMAGAIGARAMRALIAIRDTLGLDYGGIDFGLNADGGLLLFEANATMIIVAPGPDACWDYRRAAIAKVVYSCSGDAASFAKGEPDCPRRITTTAKVLPLPPQGAYTQYC